MTGLDAVGHGVGGAIGVAGRGGDPDGLSVGDVLGHGVGRLVGVGRGGDVGLVEVREGDLELLGRGRAVVGGRGDGDGAGLDALVVHLVGAVDAHDAVAAPDVEVAVAAGGVDDHGVGRVVRGVSVGRRGRDAHGGVVGGVLGDGVVRAIGVAGRADVDLVDVGQGEREGLVGRGAVGAGRSDRHGAGLAGLAVEGVCVGDGDDAGGAVADLKRARAGLRVDCVAHGVASVIVSSGAVIPTVWPLAMFSATVLAVASESVGVVTSDSSTSVRVSVKVWLA